ncbi:MAG: zinc-ribbon domain-containing protein [Clostridia bacterium]|nr:zinc-ribbon domain-containing protein [Clostridia bacterium]
MGKNYKYEKIPYEKSFAYYIIEELGIELDKIWNWEKNNENGINPYEITKSSSKKVWLYCQKHDYHNYNREGNKVGYETRCDSFHRGSRCGYCKGQYKVHYKDSLAYNRPDIARMIAIPENDLTFDDCYNMTCTSSYKKYYVKCNECGEISNEKVFLSNIVRQGYSCKNCSDGISIPNKFAYNLLKQLNINFISEYSPYYFRSNQSVDFLLKDYYIILEMDGGYGNHTREYDYWRDFLNFKYGGYKTIRIDLTNSNKYSNNLFNYLKEQIINSELTNIFDLSKIDWELIWKQCQKSKCVEAWDIYNNITHDIIKISEMLNVNRNTITRYLKKGKECGACDYSKEESNKIRAKKYSGKNNNKSTKVRNVETGEIFDTMTLAGKSVERSISAIKQAIKRGNKCGGYHWEYLKEQNDNEVA